jgi:PIN domain nuclease of toxin-antitoxin system
VIVLDTHVWVWWVNGDEQLSERAYQAIINENRLGICSISCWEVATLVRKGRLAFSVNVEQWIEQALAFPGVEILPLHWHTAMLAGGERFNFENDPADRLIVATAFQYEAPLLTADRKLHAFTEIATIW